MTRRRRRLRRLRLDAEREAIITERPIYNIQHNARAAVAEQPTKPGRWVFRSRRSSYEHRADLFLYPELDCSSMVDDYYYLDGDEETGWRFLLDPLDVAPLYVPPKKGGKSGLFLPPGSTN